MHGSNLESVYKHIPLNLLPAEYLPDEYDGPHAGSLKTITGQYTQLCCRRVSRGE